MASGYDEYYLIKYQYHNKASNERNWGWLMNTGYHKHQHHTVAKSGISQPIPKTL